MDEASEHVALIATTGTIVVTLLGLFGKWIDDRRKGKRSKVDQILANTEKTKTQVELIAIGTKEALKANLLRLYEEEHSCVVGLQKNRTGKRAWCQDKDEVFREVYKAYKNLNGNGIIDTLMGDMDIWRDRYAQSEFKQIKPDETTSEE